MTTEDMEPLFLSAREEETVPSHCEVVRRPDGSLMAEIWIQVPGCAEVWQYSLVKLSSLYG
jgi:hypothetical protein